MRSSALTYFYGFAAVCMTRNDSGSLVQADRPFVVGHVQADLPAAHHRAEQDGHADRDEPEGQVHGRLLDEEPHTKDEEGAVRRPSAAGGHQSRTVFGGRVHSTETANATKILRIHGSSMSHHEQNCGWQGRETHV